MMFELFESFFKQGFFNQDFSARRAARRAIGIASGLVLAIAASAFATACGSAPSPEESPDVTAPDAAETTEAPAESGETPAETGEATAEEATTEMAEATDAAAPEALSVDRLLGQWSSEGDVNAAYLVELELMEENGELSGVLSSKELVENGGSSGILSAIGSLEGDRATLQLYDQQGRETGEIQLQLDGETLVLTRTSAVGLAEQTLPDTAYLYLVPAN